MIKKTLFAAFASVLGVALLATPAFAAYTGSAGTSATTSSSTVTPGGSVSVTATFTNPSTGAPNAGQGVTWSFSGGGSGCTVSFSGGGTTDASGNATTTATIGTGCSGTVTFTATDATSGQFVSTSVTVAAASGGGYPNTTSVPVPAQQPLLPIGLIAIVAMAAGLGAYRVLGNRA